MKILQKICFVLLLMTFSSVYGETSLPQESLDRIEITMVPHTIIEEKNIYKTTLITHSSIFFLPAQ